MDLAITLPSGERLDGRSPLVVVGPNGSGKTRQTRNISSAAPIDFVNALRNTRVAPELPAMGVDTARSNYLSQRNQARNAHWELTSEFDYMLSQLLAQDAMAAKDFTRRFRENPADAGEPTETPLSRVEAIWKDVFLGRRLIWRDWKPVVASSVSGAPIEYSGNQMSDGEKAALFIAGRVFSAEPGILVIDEPETHFHSLLAVRLWNALEDARPDLRFLYVTHDLTFALSRRDARYVLASPTAGLRPIDIDKALPGDVAEALLGSASLSFYASRIVFCEGETGGPDDTLYSAWFAGPDTVVRPVGSSQMVIRCVEALRSSGVAHSLDAVGIIDRDYYGDEFLSALPVGVHPLPVHEVESLFALPAVVRPVAQHLSRAFDEVPYLETLKGTVNEEQGRAIAVQRWKAVVEPYLAALVATTNKRSGSLDDLEAELPEVFDMSKWSFSPLDMLRAERSRVRAALSTTSPDDFLEVVPGKQLVPIAARAVGMQVSAYASFVVEALRHTNDTTTANLRDALVEALGSKLPRRATAIALPSLEAPAV